jgi:hypothetical protein
MLDPILKLFFFQICSTYFSNIFCFCCCVLNSAPCGSDRLLPFKTLVLKMVNSPSSPAAASSPQFATASAVPPAQMSLSRCLSSDGTINIEKYRLCRQSAAAAFWWRSLVAKDSLLDGELNTHRVDHMVAAPPPTAKKKHPPRGVLARKDTEDGPLEIILPEDSLWYKAYVSNFFDAGTGIVHGE